nr:PREDICTED: 30S ribosomal protein S31, mitochondrial [Daucus carota subsp. sativus]
MAMMQFCNGAAKRFLLSADKTAAATFTSLSSSISSAAALGSPEVCGRGDKKTKSGKRFKGSYGNSRPKKEKKIERIKDKEKNNHASSS